MYILYMCVYVCLCIYIHTYNLEKNQGFITQEKENVMVIKNVCHSTYFFLNCRRQETNSFYISYAP